jgi:hypothetical protein
MHQKSVSRFYSMTQLENTETPAYNLNNFGYVVNLDAHATSTHFTSTLCTAMRTTMNCRSQESFHGIILQIVKIY